MFTTASLILILNTTMVLANLTILLTSHIEMLKDKRR